MSKKLNGWEQPDELVPENTGAQEPGQAEEPAVLAEPETDAPAEPEKGAPDDGEPEFFMEDSSEAREYLEAKRMAENVITKHRRVEKAHDKQTERPDPELLKKRSSKEPAAAPTDELVIEDVLMIAEEPPKEKKEHKEATTSRSKATMPVKGLSKTRQMLWNRRSHSFAAPLGFAFILLAVIGLVAVIWFCVNVTIGIVDNTDEKTAFEWKVYPLLMFDPAAFDEPEQLDEVFVLKTVLWKTLLENRTKYTYNDTGMLVVPASDLEVAAKSLYGDAVKLDHQSFSEGYEFFYIYDEAQKAYTVPVQGQTAQYTPRVEKIIKEDNVYTLLVGYVPPNDLWNIDTEGHMTEPVPSKYMYYDLQQTENGGYYILSVREVPKEELPEDFGSGQQQLNQTRYDNYAEEQYLAGASGMPEGSSGAESTPGAEGASGESSAEGETTATGESGTEESSEESGTEESSEESSES